MKPSPGPSILPVLLSLLFLVSVTNAQQNEVTSERRAVAGQPRQEYFFNHRSDNSQPPANGHKLLLVLPGGDGSADFNPFVINMAKFATGSDYLVAQLIAVKWTPGQQIIWPTKLSPVDGMEFTTEEFLETVIKDIARSHKLDPENIYTLSWSSGGPAAYTASVTLDEIKGSFIAMSIFREDLLPRPDKAKTHRYYLYHSPDDPVCPYRMAEDAVAFFTREKAPITLATYAGGHGWTSQNIFGDIRAGLAWLEQRD